MCFRVTTGVRGGTCNSEYIHCLKDAKLNGMLSGMKGICDSDYVSCCKENPTDMSCPKQGGALSVPSKLHKGGMMAEYFGIKQKRGKK